MNIAKHMRMVLESKRTCATCPEIDNPDSYIRYLQSALKWHDEHVPRPTNPQNTCVVLQGERLPEEVLFISESGEVMHYLPEESIHEHEELSRRLEHATEMNSMLIGMPEHDRMQIASTLTTIDGINLSERIPELEAENTKLREFAKLYLAAVENDGCDLCPYMENYDACETETDPTHVECRLYEEMREVGVEVE